MRVTKKLAEQCAKARYPVAFDLGEVSREATVRDARRFLEASLPVIEHALAYEAKLTLDEELAQAMYEEAPLGTYECSWDEADPDYKAGQVRAARRILERIIK